MVIMEPDEQKLDHVNSCAGSVVAESPLSMATALATSAPSTQARAPASKAPELNTHMVLQGRPRSLNTRFASSVLGWF